MPNEWAHPIPVRRASAVHIATRSPGRRRLALSTSNRPWDVGLPSSQEILYNIYIYIYIYITDYACIQHTGNLWWLRHSLKNYHKKFGRNWLEILEQRSLHISTLFPVSCFVSALRCSKCQQPQCGPTIRVAVLRRCVVRCRCDVRRRVIRIHRPQLLAISFVKSHREIGWDMNDFGAGANLVKGQPFFIGVTKTSLSTEANNPLRVCNDRGGHDI